MNTHDSSRRLAAIVLAGLALAAVSVPASAQSILIDAPVKAGELTVFPDINDPNTFYYVSDKPRLSTDANGKPQFSFLRYVENVRSGAAESEAREGEGGGILHCVVSLAVTPEQLRDGQRELQRVKPGATIKGPVVFRSGKFGLVTSFKDPEGKLSKQVVGLGNAPLLDGEKAAVSMQLTKLGSKILWESFATPTPDISFTFEMEIDGYRSPVSAEIEAEWEQIYSHESFGAALQTKFLAAEIKASFEDLTKKNVIKVKQVGQDDKMEQLLNVAYTKLLDQMFQPIGGTGTPSLASLAGAGGAGGGLLDRASKMYNDNQKRADDENERLRREAAARAAAGTGTPAGAGTPAGTGAAPSTQPAGDDPRPARYSAQSPTIGGGHHATASPTEKPTAQQPQQVSAPPIAIVAAFEMKRVRQSGKFYLNLNKATTDRLTLRFDENIGDLRALRGDQAHFREVNLDDPLYVQREIVVSIDGPNAQDFGQFINFATVRLRKKHAGGAETNDEVRVDRKNFSSEGNAFKLLYGFKGDNDRRKWMDYEYMVTWSIFGGKQIEEPWKPSSAGAIALVPPYQRRPIDLQADPAAIAAANVRAITIKLLRPDGTEAAKPVTMNIGKGEFSKTVDAVLPSAAADYGYEIAWLVRGGQTINSGRKTTASSLLLVDELPR